MLIKKRNNESGIILLIVIAFILLMSIILAGMFSRMSSPSFIGAGKAKSVQADILARGAHWRAYSKLRSDDTLPSNFTETVNGVVYSISFTRTPLTGPDEIGVVVSYPD